MSATKPVSRLRMIVPQKKRKVLDPRFDALFGTVNAGLVKNSYAFIEELETREIQQLREQIRHETDENALELLKKDLQRLVRMQAFVLRE
jgi:hypothetical protein